MSKLNYFLTRPVRFFEVKYMVCSKRSFIFPDPPARVHGRCCYAPFPAGRSPAQSGLRGDQSVHAGGQCFGGCGLPVQGFGHLSEPLLERGLFGAERRDLTGKALGVVQGLCRVVETGLLL